MSLTAKEKLVRLGVKSGVAPFTGPFGLQVGVTDFCNFSCEFCATFSHRRPESDTPAPKNQLDPAVFHRLVADAKAMEVEQISLVGVGEPLLHKEIVPFVAAVTGAGIRCMLTTNGLALTDEKLDGLIGAGLDILNISVNAATAETYALVNGPAKEGFFPTLVERLTKLGRRAERPRLSLRMVVNARTAAEIGLFARLVMAVGAEEGVFQNYATHRWAKEVTLDPATKAALAPALEQAGRELEAAGIDTNARFLAGLWRGDNDEADPDYYRRHPCLVGWTYALIMEDGSVRPCCYCGASLGNINDRSFREIWEGEEYAAFRKLSFNLPTAGKAPERCVCFTLCGSI
ncbi:MAG: radical SAM protein, partial [Nitrospinae bacterium]|nr:radical SAM protein [Nitrospinota bacterium]